MGAGRLKSAEFKAASDSLPSCNISYGVLLWLSLRLNFPAIRLDC